MSSPRTVDLLFEESQRTIAEIALLSGLAPARVEAIADGRWTPSPDERARIAAAFGVAVDQISWGHSMNPRNVRYRRSGFRRED